MSRIWAEEIDRDYWWRHAVVAPTQNGKTLMCYVLVVMYYLFELNETVIIGLPDTNMANDKFERDFKPIIMASRYRDLWPDSGPGAKGGRITSSITFRNGAMLRFMSGGSGDKGRAGFAGCRVVAITETDGLDESGESSREADKCKQIEARTRGFDDSRRRCFMECTASFAEGKIWQEYTNGTASRMLRPCPYCGEWVCPEREHLKGWQDAKDIDEAREKSAWHCPSCDTPWTQQDRESGWEQLQLVHEGQDVDKDTGEIVGESPRTRTLGFRWGAIDNPFQSAGRAGAEEWEAKNANDKENAEKEICQWTNAIPYKSPDMVVSELEPETVAARATTWKRGIIPPNCIGIAIAIDTHKRNLYWEGKAIINRPEGLGLHVFDHQVLNLDVNKLMKEAIIGGLKKLKRHFDAGWPDESGRKWLPSQVWIDSSYKPHKMPVYIFCAAANQGLDLMELVWRPLKGYGEGQLRGISPYRAPESVPAAQTRRQNLTLYVGNDYHINRVLQGKTDWMGVQLVHCNADVWKSTFHQGFEIDEDQEGAITLFECTGPDRDTYEAQVCGEVQREKVVKDRGTVTTWHQISANHYLDAGYMSTAAADFVVANRKRIGRKAVDAATAASRSYPDRPTAQQLAQRHAAAGAR